MKEKFLFAGGAIYEIASYFSCGWSQGTLLARYKTLALKNADLTKSTSPAS